MKFIDILIMDDSSGKWYVWTGWITFKDQVKDICILVVRTVYVWTNLLTSEKHDKVIDILIK